MTEGRNGGNTVDGIVRGSSSMGSDSSRNKLTDMHQARAFADKVALVGELEHMARHSVAAYAESKEIEYLDTAKEATEVRRKVMGQIGITERDWCLAKSAAAIKQLAGELQDPYAIVATDRLSSKVWSKVLGIELAGCEACREDME